MRENNQKSNRFHHTFFGQFFQTLTTQFDIQKTNIFLLLYEKLTIENWQINKILYDNSYINLVPI